MSNNLLLFYSNHCKSCGMLIDNIKRYNATEHFKLVNIDVYLSKGVSLPKIINSVPSLLFTENKNLLSGKQVFDFLLVPGKGFLFNLPKKGDGTSKSTESKNNTTIEEPISFSIVGNSLGDGFSMIDDEPGKINENRINYWADINENQKIETTEDDNGTNKETRTKKELPDLGNLQSSREMDLQKYLNNNPLPPSEELQN